jgi:hypothetical protein
VTFGCSDVVGAGLADDDHCTSCHEDEGMGYPMSCAFDPRDWDVSAEVCCVVSREVGEKGWGDPATWDKLKAYRTGGKT